MNNTNLKIGCTRYDHVRALFDGAVQIEGVNATFEDAKIVSDIFENMVRHHAYDVSELGLTFYLRTLEMENPPFVAIPIFPNRQFRHSAIFINKASGIKWPEDLIGKTIGEFGIYGHDAGVWPKGILADDFGVRPEQSRWVVGATDWYMPPYDFVPQPVPAGVAVRPVAKGEMLGPMLEAGKIDALISAVVPQCILQGSDKVGRLFPDYETVERGYFARTEIFPIMHTVVIRKDVLAAHPGIARSIYDGFVKSKESAADEYRKGVMEQHGKLMIPWFTPLMAENLSLMGRDWWPYGLAANRKAMDTYLRYFHEQGLSSRRFTCEEIFLPELLDT